MNGFDVLRVLGVDVIYNPPEVTLEELAREINTNEVVRALARLSLVSTPWPVETLAFEVGAAIDKHRYFEGIDAAETIVAISEALNNFRLAERRLVEIISGQPSPDRCTKCHKLWSSHRIPFGEATEGLVEGQFGNGAKGLFC